MAFSLGHWKAAIEDNYLLRFLGNCPPTPPLSQQFAKTEKDVLVWNVNDLPQEHGGGGGGGGGGGKRLPKKEKKEKRL